MGIVCSHVAKDQKLSNVGPRKEDDLQKVTLSSHIFTDRVRSTTEGYVFTGVCLLTGGGGYPSQVPMGGGVPQGAYPPARSRWGGYPKVLTPPAKVPTPPQE